MKLQGRSKMLSYRLFLHIPMIERGHFIQINYVFTFIYIPDFHISMISYIQEPLYNIQKITLISEVRGEES